MQQFYLIQVAWQYHKHPKETELKFRQRLRAKYNLDLDSELEHKLNELSQRYEILASAEYYGVSGKEINTALDTLYTSVKQLNLED
jgi:hypothetical protein